MENIKLQGIKKKFDFKQLKTQEISNRNQQDSLQSNEYSNLNFNQQPLLPTTSLKRKNRIQVLKKLFKILMMMSFWLDFKSLINIHKSVLNNQIGDNFHFSLFQTIVQELDYKLTIFVNAIQIEEKHIYFEPQQSSSFNQVPLSTLITGCTQATMTQTGEGCSFMSLSITIEGTLQSNYPQPNLECIIQVACSTPSLSSKTFTVSSFDYLCTSKSKENILQYSPLIMKDYVFYQGIAATPISLSASDIASFTYSFASSSCYFYDGNYNTLPYTFPTASQQTATNYFVICQSTDSKCNHIYSKSFTITVKTLSCTPLIITQPVSYSNQIFSPATPVALTTSVYASTSNPCVLSYQLLKSDGSLYSGSAVSIDSSTGAVSIVSNVLISENLKIQVTSSYSTISSSSVNIYPFTVNQFCGSYCTPTITGIASSYNLNVQSSSQIIIQSYAGSSPSGCIMSYSLQNHADNTPYTGTDI